MHSRPQPRQLHTTHFCSRFASSILDCGPPDPRRRIFVSGAPQAIGTLSLTLAVTPASGYFHRHPRWHLHRRPGCGRGNEVSHVCLQHWRWRFRCWNSCHSVSHSRHFSATFGWWVGRNGVSADEGNVHATLIQMVTRSSMTPRVVHFGGE